MKRSRLVVLGVGLLLVVTVPARGADDKEPSKAPAPQRTPLLQRLGQLLPPEVADKLHLTDEQKKQVAKLQDEFSEKRAALLGEVPEEAGKALDEIKKARDNGEKPKLGQAAMPVVGKLLQVRQLRDDYDKKVRALLTDEQKKTLDELTRERPLRRFRDRLNPPPTEKPEDKKPDEKKDK
jgi:Spy/CpxP family protein refolding chaperone